MLKKIIVAEKGTVSFGRKEKGTFWRKRGPPTIIGYLFWVDGVLNRYII